MLVVFRVAPFSIQAMGMAERTISLKELRHHVRALDQLITEAWFKTGAPAEIDFSFIRKHAGSIMGMVADDASSPHAATATSPPKAAANERKADAQKRAAHQRAAADKAPVDLRTILGLSHIRKG
jgi:hypothetical protein